VASVWVEGIDELNTVTAELRVKRARIGAQGIRVIKRQGHQIERWAKLFVPVDTGYLRSTIGPPVVQGSAASASAEVSVSATAEYAIYVEFGTRHMAPRAYMGPALDQVSPEFVAAVKAISDPFDKGR